MQRTAPTFYKAELKRFKSRTRSEAIERRAPYLEPRMITTTGQVCGLFAVVAVLVFAGYLAHLGEVGWAGGIAIADLATLAGVFVFSSRKDAETDQPEHIPGEE